MSVSCKFKRAVIVADAPNVDIRRRVTRDRRPGAILAASQDDFAFENRLIGGPTPDRRWDREKIPRTCVARPAVLINVMAARNVET